MMRGPATDRAAVRLVKVVWPLSVLLAAALALVVSCGGDSGRVSIQKPGPPVGIPFVPDIAPGPPQDARMTREDGRWLIRFTTFLANVGDGDFVLRAVKSERGWEVDQDVRYSESGAKVYPTRARLVWGGDGHNHWHVERVAIGRLVPFEKDGRAPQNNGQGRADTKVGFCYYDHSRLADDAAQSAVYPPEACGKQDDTAIGMGLTVGWMDIYGSRLPGQAIDVTDLPDGEYRLWVNVDSNHWFRERRRDNNVTWADLEIVTKANGDRDVRDVRSGPPINLGP
jgi:Lysyl oxidase